MAKKVGALVAVLAIILVLWYWYTHRDPNALGSGNVFSTNSDLDGNQQVGPTPSRSDAPGTINTKPAPGSVSNQPPQDMKSSIAGGPIQDNGSGAVPARDSESANAPNGMRFGGSSRFQWYRQGNLTWRVDTSSGSTCVAFATMEEWRKPIVSSHGCGNA